MRTNRLIASLLLLFVLASSVFAQNERYIQILLTPSHADYLYKPGQDASFDITVLRNNVPLKDACVKVELSYDMMDPFRTDSLRLADGHGKIKAGSMKTPGFMRCIASFDYEGRHYEGRSTVGYSPERLQPVTTEPADFKEFWDSVLVAARKQPLEPVMTLQPNLCTDKVDVYHVGFGNDGWGSRFYGMLCVPKAPGKYPAILKVPGAGVRGYAGDVAHSAKGFITLEVGIHGIPVNVAPEVYSGLYQGALKGYHTFNIDDRERFYYKRVYTGCIRAIDFIETLPQYNGNLGVIGGSQGGGLAIVIAGLDPRVDALVSMYPAITDQSGYTVANRAGGWPHTLKDAKMQTPNHLATIRYYDAVNFGRHIKVPGYYTFGYNDMVCPPTTSYSVYNVISAPKKLLVEEPTAHYAYPEQSSIVWSWLMDTLKNLPAEK